MQRATATPKSTTSLVAAGMRVGDRRRPGRAAACVHVEIEAGAVGQALQALDAAAAVRRPCPGRAVDEVAQLLDDRRPHDHHDEGDRTATKAR